MAGSRKDMIGLRFGKLVVVSFARISAGRQAYWLCKCDCGNEITVRGSNLRNDGAVSCGCVWRGYSGGPRTHGRTGSFSFRRWNNMMDRCYNWLNISYKYYGLRGISVCQRWWKFECFDEDTTGVFGPDDTVGRIDNNSWYHLGNVRGESPQMQANNRRRPVRSIVKKYIGSELDWMHHKRTAGDPPIPTLQDA
jgi:hypothetical protein